MFIAPINYNYKNLSTNKKQIQNTVMVKKNINFKGFSKFKIIDPNSLKNEEAKEILKTIQKYVKIIGKNGSVKDVATSKDAKSYVSIKRNENMTNIQVKDNFKDLKLDIDINEKGQMVRGFLRGLEFERSHRNIRRMFEGGRVFRPEASGKMFVPNGLGSTIFFEHRYDKRIDDEYYKSLHIDYNKIDYACSNLFSKFAGLYNLVF